MSMVLCPECGNKISQKATVCPTCGYFCEDPKLPISVQETYEPTPIFQCHFMELREEKEVPVLIPIEDSRSLFRLYGKWEYIQKKLPAIAAVIMEMAKREKVLIAEIDPFIKKMIEKGVYRFSIDKQGRLLPTIQGENGIVKQVRLRETALGGDILGAFSNLQMQATMMEILEEVRFLSESIQNIHAELQNDRIAMMESAKDKFLAAVRMQDTRLREAALLNVVQSATDAKRVLMRNFSDTLEYVLSNSHKGSLQMLLEGKDGRNISDSATEAFEALVMITNAMRIECQGYALLGEYEAVKECLGQFRDFVRENGLDQRDTLLKLNENTPRRCMATVEDFTRVTGQIASFVETGRLRPNPAEGLAEGQSEG